MALASLLVAGASTMLVAATYGYVGLRLGRCAPAGANGDALRFFALWWGTTSLNQAVGGALYVAAGFGWADPALHVAYTVLQRFLLAASLVGLMYYVLYLLRGRAPLWSLVGAYALFGLVSVYGVMVRGPTGIAVTGWRVNLTYAQPDIPRIQAMTALFILLPPIAGCVSLLALRRHVEAPTTRFRLAAVGGGLLVWWTFAVFAGQPQLLGIEAVQALNRVVGLAVAVVILLAYQPTRWMQERFHLEPYGRAA